MNGSHVTEALLPNEQLLFEQIRKYILVHQYPPSIRELPGLLGKKSMKQVEDLMRQLRQKGYIDWVNKQSRTYRLLLGNMPLRGFIQAGYVVEHPVDSFAYIDVSSSWYKPEDYALQVQGDSMVESHICDGDFVIIRPINDVEFIKPGTITAVWVEGEGSTLKHFYLEGSQVVLKAANLKYQTQIVDIDRILVQGILIALHRPYKE